MYLWKTWHDSRTRVVIYILAALCLGLLHGLDVISAANWHITLRNLKPHYLFGSPIYNFDFNTEAATSALTWAVLGFRRNTFPGVMWSFIGHGAIALLLASLSLGVSGVGREYDADTMSFVLTRPCSRMKFIFTDWAVGLTGMVIIVSGLAFPLVPFLCVVHAQGPGNVLGGLPALWVLGAAVYGLSHFMTLVAGSASKGLILSMATILTYYFLPNALHEWWHADALLRATRWTMKPLEFGAWPLSPFDWGPTGFWLAAAACFLGASVAWIKFREV